MDLVLGQVLQQVFINGERTAGCHLLDGIDTEVQGEVKLTTYNIFNHIFGLNILLHINCNQKADHKNVAMAATYPTVMTSPEFLSVTKLLAMVMITGSMIYMSGNAECLIVL